MRPPLIAGLLACVATWWKSSASLRLENLALRHQLAVDKQRLSSPAPSSPGSGSDSATIGGVSASRVRLVDLPLPRRCGI